MGTHTTRASSPAPTGLARRLVIVGGGFAGFWAAAAARAVLEAEAVAVAGDVEPDSGPEIEIQLVSASALLTMRPRLYEANPASLAVELAPLLSTLDVTLTVDTAERVVLKDDGLGGHVECESGGRVEFDRLVIATGSVMRRPDMPGMESAHSIDTAHDAIAFDVRLAELAGGTRSPTIVVVGAGFTGIELALELRNRMVAHGNAAHAASMRIVLVDRAPVVASELGPNPRPVIEAALADAGIETRLGVAVKGLVGGGVEIHDPGSAHSETIAADVVVLNTGLHAAPFVERIAGAHDQLGRLVVPPTLQSPDCPAVFVAGDAASVDTGDGHTALQSCQHALQMGRAAGANAARHLLNRPLRPYQQLRYVTCLDLGRAGAVLTTGWDRQVLKVGDEAKAIKRRINTETIYPPAGSTREELVALALPPT
jgi:NADH:ubiquinone reductase (H+-translocating)